MLNPVIANLYEQKRLIEQQIRDTEASCTHPNTIKTAGSNTGNWDSSDDRYWYDCMCPDCGRRWSEDQ